MVWSFASFWAREGVLGEDGEWVRWRNSVTRKDVDGSEVKWPQPKLLGQREGTTAWMALREACSPG